MTVYLARKGFHYSPITIHKYMNKEMGLYAIVRPKKPEYLHGKPHKVFENKLAQNFTAERANQKWCTDFTYLFLKNGEVRYNCSILDLYDRSIIASITDRHITSELAIRTLQKALDSQPMRKGELLLHSDQGAQYTSKAFVEYCESVHVIQSMSKAGCPYDNAPMEASVYKGYKRDKIEMRGDRAEMSDFPLYLNTVAGGLDCRNQAIGGFSFVVKIYALPVVEIIGQFLYLLGRYGFDAQIGYCF